jgi:hypothetical protein
VTSCIVAGLHLSVTHSPSPISCWSCGVAMPPLAGSGPVPAFHHRRVRPDPSPVLLLLRGTLHWTPLPPPILSPPAIKASPESPFTAFLLFPPPPPYSLGKSVQHLSSPPSPLGLLSEHEHWRALTASESRESATAFFSEHRHELESHHFCHISPIPPTLPCCRTLPPSPSTTAPTCCR